MNSNSSWLVITVLLVSSAVFCFPCFKDTANILDDMPFHLGRIQSIAANLQAGNILPTIYGDAVNNFGYASSLFYPDLWLYIPAVLTLSGFKLIRAYQIFLLIITLVTGIVMYYATNRMLQNMQIFQHYQSHRSQLLTTEQAVSLLSTIGYMAFPYRLINVYLRGALGEILAFIFLPLVFCGLTEIFLTRKRSWQMLMLGMAGLLYSHIISSFMISIVIALTLAFNLRSAWQVKYTLLKIAITTALLSAAFLLPLIEQMQSNQFFYNTANPFGSLSEQALTVISTPSSSLLILINISVLALFYLIYNWLKKRGWYPDIALLLFLTFYLTFMTSNLFPWFLLDQLPLFKYIQFPWRILLLVSYLFPITFAFVAMHFLKKKNSFWYFILVSIVLTSGFLTTNTLVHLAANYKQNTSYTPPAISIGRGEYLPAKVKLSTITKRQALPLAVAGEISVERYARSGNMAELLFSNASSRLLVEFPIIYYKGYVASLNGNPFAVTESENGMVQVEIRGINSGRLVVIYEHTAIQQAAIMISFVTALFLVFVNFRANSTAVPKNDQTATD